MISNQEYRVVSCEILSQKKKVMWKKHHADVYLDYRVKGSGVGFGVTNPNNGQFLSCNDQPLKLKYAAYGKNTIDLGICGKNAYSPLWILNGTLEIQADDIPFKCYSSILLREG